MIYIYILIYRYIIIYMNYIHIKVKPVYNELCYYEFSVITKHMVFTDRIDFFKN